MPQRTGFPRVTTAILAALALLALPGGALGAAERPLSSASAPASAGAVPDRVIVVWEPGTSRPERAAAREDADAPLVRTLGDPRFQLVRPAAGHSVSDALAALRGDPAVRTATRDGFSVLHATTNDPLLGQQWGLQNLGLGVHGFAGALAGADVDAPAAWDRTRGSSSVAIADLDSGYRFDAPDLGPVAWTNPADPQDGADNDGNGIVDDVHGADFVGSEADTPRTDGDPTDDDLIEGGHGVHTAGTMGAAGNNGVGISGVAQDVRIMPLRVCSFSTSSEETRCPTSSQIQAINYAGAHGARAANMSLGGTGSNTTVRDAFAANPNVLFVISAGNDGDDNELVPTYPCDYDPSTSGVGGAIDNVVCVAALDQADTLADFSNFGARSVDVGAPGTEILSTYPASAPRLREDFEANDFATAWASSGAGFDRAAAGDGPLASFGMTDSPGAAPGASTFHQVTSTTALAIPAGSGACTLSGSRFLSLGADGAFSYFVVPSAGNPIEFEVTRGTAGASLAPFSTAPIGGLAGLTVRVRFEYTAPSAPTSADGVWLDDLALDCNAPLSTVPSYDFLDGTSMAAPHVTGTAGLLFSLNPSASVPQVRSALLATVQPVASLGGRTTSGGRIDAAAALDEIRQPDTAITSRPRASTSSTRAAFTFARADAPLTASFECKLDRGAFGTCASPTRFQVGSGEHTFAVRAKSPRGVVTDPSPAIAHWTMARCKVPRLAGRSLRRAKRALRAAHCALGRVKRVRRSGRSRPLVVASTRPRAGAIREQGARVKLTLAARRAKHRRHQRRR